MLPCISVSNDIHRASLGVVHSSPHTAVHLRSALRGTPTSLTRIAQRPRLPSAIPRDFRTTHRPSTACRSRRRATSSRSPQQSIYVSARSEAPQIRERTCSWCTTVCSGAGYSLCEVPTFDAFTHFLRPASRSIPRTCHSTRIPRSETTYCSLGSSDSPHRQASHDTRRSISACVVNPTSRPPDLIAAADAVARRWGGAARHSSSEPGRITKRWAICTGAGASADTLREAVQQRHRHLDRRRRTTLDGRRCG